MQHFSTDLAISFGCLLFMVIVELSRSLGLVLVKMIFLSPLLITQLHKSQCDLIRELYLSYYNRASI